MGCTHTIAEHNAMKVAGVWETLDLVGYQPGDDEHGDIELRNAACGSTLGRKCLLTHDERETVRAATRMRHESFRAQVAAAVQAVAA
jgi:hypothetical protein